MHQRARDTRRPRSPATTERSYGRVLLRDDGGRVQRAPELVVRACGGVAQPEHAPVGLGHAARGHRCPPADRQRCLVCAALVFALATGGAAPRSAPLLEIGTEMTERRSEAGASAG